MEAYQQRIDILQKVSDDFVDKLNSHIMALFENMVNFKKKFFLANL